MKIINKPIDTLFGVKTDNDYRKEEKTYFFGSSGNCPIALFLVMNSAQKNIVARYFNKFIHTSEANKLQGEVEKSKFKITEEMINQFNGHIVSNEKIPFELKSWSPPSPSKNMMSQIGEEPTDIYKAEMMNLHMYSGEFAKYLTMLTADYDSQREGVVMTCPMSYIEFWGRFEFKEAYKALDATIQMLTQEVAHVLEKRGFKVNLENMTVEISQYPGFKIIHSYGW